MRDGQSKAALPETTACSLAEEYDVSCLSRNEYSLLLCDLRNAGFITTQEFSAGYGGTLPHGILDSPKPMPYGNNKADFIALLKQYIRYCGEFLEISAKNGVEQTHTQSLLSTYSRLYTLFKQIHSAASRTD